MRNRVQNIFLQVQTELDNFLGMETGTEPAAPATEGKKKLMVTVRAADTGEAFGKVAALKITLNDLGDYRTEIAELHETKRKSIYPKMPNIPKAINKI